jgi:hypothetical protein
MAVRPTDDDMDDESVAPTPRRLERGKRVNDGRGKRIANREVWITLPAPYDNLKILAWLDFPQSVANQFLAVEGEDPEEATERVLDACKTIFLEHDGWEDHRGALLPQPSDDEFWDRIPTQLAGLIVKALQQEMEGNGGSRASRETRRGSSR